MKFPVMWLPFVTVPVGGYIAGPHQLNSCQNFNLHEQISNKQTNKHTLGFQPQIPAIQKTHCYGDVTSHFTPLCFSKKASVSCTSFNYFISQLMKHILGFQPRIPAMSSFLTLLIGFTCFANGEWSNFLEQKEKTAY